MTELQTSARSMPMAQPDPSAPASESSVPAPRRRSWVVWIFVAIFLAVLELYKREMVDLSQAHSFGELVITWIAKEGSYAVSDVEEYDDRSSVGTR